MLSWWKNLLYEEKPIQILDHQETQLQNNGLMG